VRFDASGSYDPDGSIVKYIWDFGDGASGTGKIVAHTYSRAGTYTVRLTVQDDRGATDVETKTIQVSTSTLPSTFSGMPVIDKPGIYVWGDLQGRWHITVASDPEWASPRQFRVSLETDGVFADVARTPPEGSYVAKRVVKRTGEVKAVVWKGSIQDGRMELVFSLVGSILDLELYLDLNGDGRMDREESRNCIFLGKKKVHPPDNHFSIGSPQGIRILRPSQNFRIGACKEAGGRWVCQWITTIQDLESGT